MVIYKTLYIEGFGSIVNPITYNLNAPGLTIIKGDIGSGKTTLIDALYWVLFGVKTKKKSTVEPWPNLIFKGYKGTKVELDLEIDEVPYKIIRCSEYSGKVEGRAGKNRLVILRDGKEDSHIDKRDTKKEVINLIGYSQELFRSTIFFGQGVDKFMQEESPIKKKILEEAFMIKYITLAQEKAKKDLDKYVKELSNLRLEYEPIQSKLEVEKESLRYEGERVTIEQGKLDKQIKDLQGIITNLLPTQIKIDEGEAKLRDVQTQIDTLKDKVSKLTAKTPKESTELKDSNKLLIELGAKLQVLATDLNKMEKEGSTCTKCGQKLPNKSKLISKLKEQIAHKKAAIDILRGDVHQLEREHSSSVSKHLSIVDTKIKEIKKLEREQKDLRESLHPLYTRKGVLKASIKSLEEAQATVIINREEEIRERIKKLKANLKALKPEYKNLNRKVKELGWVIKGPLANSGLKALIFDTMLSSLNHELSRYEYLLGFRVEVAIKMESANKDVVVYIYKGKEVVPSQDLSGGQKQLTNLVIGLCFHKMGTEANPTNLFILDECFEGLNERGIQTVADLIAQIAKDKSVHLVTHRNFNPSNARVINVQLSNSGTTEISS